MNNQTEQKIKDSIYKEVKADGQSDKYFENMWTFWWGGMDTNIQNGIINAFENHPTQPLSAPVDAGAGVMQEMIDHMNTHYEWFVKHSPEYGVIPQLIKKATELLEKYSTPPTKEAEAGLSADEVKEFKNVAQIFDENIVWFEKDEVVRHPNLMRLAVYDVMQKYADQFLAAGDGWVSVEDGLPEIEQEVNVYFKNSVGWHVSGAYWDGKNFVEKCERCGFNEPYSYADARVTHWKPLPAPPASNQ